MIETWPLISSKTESNNKIFSLMTQTVQSPRTGRFHDFYVLETLPWVNIISVTADRKILLVRQYRHGSKEVTIEIPGGIIDPGQTPEEAARRELAEETGHVSANWSLLGKVRPNPAILNNYCYTYLALDAAPERDVELDETEDLEWFSASLRDIEEMVLSGEIDHSLVLNALYFLKTSGLEQTVFKRES